MKRPPRILHPLSSLSGRLALAGLNPQLVALDSSDYNALLVTIRGATNTHRVLWYLPAREPFYWAFRLLGADDQILFESLTPLPTREGIAPLVPVRADIPLLHVTTDAQVVADFLIHFDYRQLLPTASSSPELASPPTP